ncbi:MAG: hypothetical protein H6709_11365 [Kofleriaceae bacterium]|nr:hypothetical protein [Myxococcales bacterium]MCB9562950.1 hypothetical protein [Kofleriaceae bacterium]MCB9572674.1 hypothetical protein [Kofleriaceae bacterium]
MGNQIRIFAASFVAVLSLAACGKSGGGGGDVADRAVKAADGACACQDFDCTKAFIAELNKLSIKEEAAVKKLPEDRAKIYKEAQSRGADCQDKLRK